MRGSDTVNCNIDNRLVENEIIISPKPIKIDSPVEEIQIVDYHSLDVYMQ